MLKAGAVLQKRHAVRDLLITLGEAGMLLVEEGQKPYHTPTRAQEVFDVSGAGDTAIAAFTLALAAGATGIEAAEIANHAAGVVVGKLGTATLNVEELREMFAKTGGMLVNRRAVFFDRDDTLMVNVPYLGDPSLVEIFPEAAEALFALRKAGFLLFVVSNQSGVGRGLITREQVSRREHGAAAPARGRPHPRLLPLLRHAGRSLRDRPQALAGAAAAGGEGARCRPGRIVLHRRPALRHRVRAQRRLPHRAADARRSRAAATRSIPRTPSRAKKAHYITST